VAIPVIITSDHRASNIEAKDGAGEKVEHGRRWRRRIEDGRRGRRK
jgi:hypothetical protein